MNNMLRCLLVPLTLVIPILLNGCAGAVVGGTATGVALVHDRRTAGTILEDQIIEFKALEKFHNKTNQDLITSAHINMTSYNNVVLLTGEAQNESLRSRAYEIIKSIEKVKRIHNEIIIAAPSSYLTRSSDTWITTKVKTKLFQIRDIESFDPTRVKIITENGTVYLMGLVTRREAASITEVARKVTGVQRVVKVFEYID